MRGVALAPLAALAVHQLRYVLAYRGAATEELAAQGHSYLHSLTPWIVLSCATAFGGFLSRLARARATGRREAPPSLIRLWLAAALGLLAIYASQELLEGFFATGHPEGVVGIFGDGGLWALPAAAFIGGLLALALRGAAALIARVAAGAAGRMPARGAPVCDRPLHRRAGRARRWRRRRRGGPRRGWPSMPTLTIGEIRLMRHRTAMGLAAAAALAAPAAAEAHVSIHPNVVPSGAPTVLTLRVPNEMDNANTTRIAVKMPPGFLDVSAAPPPGWSFSTKTQKLTKPVKTDDGTLTTQVSEVDFTGGKIPPGQFAEFPMSVAIPGNPAQLTFKTVQTYSNGQTVRWIGPADPTSPRRRSTSRQDGVIQDVAGGEAGPPAGLTGASTGAQKPASNAPAATRVVEKGSGASKGLAIAALVLGIIGTVLGGAALLRRRRSAVRRDSSLAGTRLALWSVRVAGRAVGPEPAAAAGAASPRPALEAVLGLVQADEPDHHARQAPDRASPSTSDRCTPAASPAEATPATVR